MSGAQRNSPFSPGFPRLHSSLHPSNHSASVHPAWPGTVLGLGIQGWGGSSWPFRSFQVREGSKFSANTLGLVLCRRGKSREGRTSLQLGPMKIGLSTLCGTRVQLEWLKVATAWGYGEHSGAPAVWIALRMPSWSVTWAAAPSLGWRCPASSNLISRSLEKTSFFLAYFQVPQNDLSIQKGFCSF